MLLIFVKYICGHQHIQEIFKLDYFFIENYYKMCVAIIMADPVLLFLIYYYVFFDKASFIIDMQLNLYFNHVAATI